MLRRLLPPGDAPVDEVDGEARLQQALDEAVAAVEVEDVAAADDARHEQDRRAVLHGAGLGVVAPQLDLAARPHGLLRRRADARELHAHRELDAVLEPERVALHLPHDLCDAVVTHGRPVIVGFGRPASAHGPRRALENVTAGAAPRVRRGRARARTVAAVRRVLITGGGRGIGRAVALRLAEDGHTVAVTARSQGEIDAVAAEVGGVALAVDLSDGEAASALAGRAAEALGGPVEIFVHAAGVASIAPLHKLDPEDWRRAFAVNVDAAFHVSRELMRPMTRRRLGAHRDDRVAARPRRRADDRRLRGLQARAARPHARDRRRARAARRDRQRGRPGLGRHADGARRDRQVRRGARRPARGGRSGACCASRRSGASSRPTRSPAWSATCAASRPAGVTGQALHIDGGSYQA